MELIFLPLMQSLLKRKLLKEIRASSTLSNLYGYGYAKNRGIELIPAIPCGVWCDNYVYSRPKNPKFSPCLEKIKNGDCPKALEIINRPVA